MGAPACGQSTRLSRRAEPSTNHGPPDCGRRACGGGVGSRRVWREQAVACRAARGPSAVLAGWRRPRAVSDHWRGKFSPRRRLEEPSPVRAIPAFGKLRFLRRIFDSGTSVLVSPHPLGVPSASPSTVSQNALLDSPPGVGVPDAPSISDPRPCDQDWREVLDIYVSEGNCRLRLLEKRVKQTSARQISIDVTFVETAKL